MDDEPMDYEEYHNSGLERRDAYLEEQAERAEEEEEHEDMTREPFMVPEFYETDVFECEDRYGTTQWIPADLFWNAAGTPTLDDLDTYRDEQMGPIVQYTRKHGWLGRMTAPGYLDCTSWYFAETEAEVKKYLGEYHMSDEFGEPIEEFASPEYAEFFAEEIKSE
jgi:hypothetical protein